MKVGKRQVRLQVLKGRPPGRSRSPVKVAFARWSSTRRIVGFSVRLGNRVWVVTWPAASSQRPIPSSHVAAAAQRYTQNLLQAGKQVTISSDGPGHVRISGTDGASVRRRLPDE